MDGISPNATPEPSVFEPSVHAVALTPAASKQLTAFKQAIALCATTLANNNSRKRSKQDRIVGQQIPVATLNPNTLYALTRELGLFIKNKRCLAEFASAADYIQSLKHHVITECEHIAHEVNHLTFNDNIFPQYKRNAIIQSIRALMEKSAQLCQAHAKRPSFFSSKKSTSSGDLEESMRELSLCVSTYVHSNSASFRSKLASSIVSSSYASAPTLILNKILQCKTLATSHRPLSPKAWNELCFAVTALKEKITDTSLYADLDELLDTTEPPPKRYEI